MDTTALDADLADLVAYPLVRLGYVPHGSLCLVGTVPRGGAIGLGPVARVDIPDLADVIRFLAQLGEELGEAGWPKAVALAVGPVGGTLQTLRADPRVTAAHRELVEAGRLSAVDAGGADGMFLLAGDRWSHLRCAVPGCCRREGRDLEQVRSGRLWTRHVLQGRVVLDARDQLGVPRCTDPRCRATGRVPRALPPVLAEESRRQEAVRWEEAVVGGAADHAHPADSRRLAAALVDVRLRDAVLARAVDPTAGPVERHLDPTGVAAALAAARPPGREVETVGHLLEAAAAHGSEEGRTAALATLGYLLWWSGLGARADVVTRQALAVQGGHGLAVLVSRVLAARVAPPWVR